MLLTGSIVRDAEALAGSIASAVVASDQVTRVAVISLLARGHLLLSDVPGVGKTLLARAVAASINGDFKRIQFTPDLLPTDITGSSIFLRAEERFEFMPGPIFANFVLADEINRASARTQSALLEAMAEGQVSVDGTTQRLPDPFWVVATQNEVDGYGTYPLPQAQLDRFIASMSIGYPDVSGQVTILERNEAGEPSVEAVLSAARLREMQDHVRRVEVARPTREYMARLAGATRSHPQLPLGVSPRAAVHLQRASQALAALVGDEFVAPEHIKAVAVQVLAHRLAPSSSSSKTAGEIIQEILQTVPVPA